MNPLKRTTTNGLHQFNCNELPMLISLSSALTLFLLIVQFNQPSAAWMPDVKPDWQIKPDKINAVFIGNKTDYFKILDQDAHSVLIGARDMIYNISIKDLKEMSRLEWNSSQADRELCTLKGKHEAECHNYIRVFARLENEQILVCGTNSYKPRCRHYAPNVDDELEPHKKYEIVRDVEAQGLCPYSPDHNSTYAFADGQLYSATVADFSGSDPLIYRENLRTEQYDLKQLNQPDFVGAFERDQYVLFFFREIAMEYMNFGKTVYSRVGRICKNDRGGPYTLAKSWTSFLKARLNCSMPGDFPFYFDEIQAISPVIQSGLNSLVYAVFTTSVNAIPGSAVCAFNIADIMQAFEGNFKDQKDFSSHWLPLQEDQISEPRPGKCVEDSRMLSTINVNFIKNHPLMERSVPPMYGRPLMTKVNLQHRLTAVAIESQVMGLNGEYYDVLYTGTDDGKVTKFFNIRTPSNQSDRPDKLKTIVISETQVLPLGVPVRELVVSSPTNSLLVISDGKIFNVDLHHCAAIRDCMSCLSLQDPNCAWDQQNHECKSLTSSNNKFGTKSYIQSLNTTKKAAANLCPKTIHGTLSAEGGAGNPSLIPLIPKNVPVVNIDLQQIMPTNDENLLAKKLHYLNVGAGVGVGSVTTNSADSGNDFIMDNSSGDHYPSTNFNSHNGDDDDDDENKINFPSIDSNHLVATSIPDGPNWNKVPGKDDLKVANWCFLGLGFVIIFVVGCFVGRYSSKRMCQASPNHTSLKQLNTNGQFALNRHKDINCLIRPNDYINHTKPSLDLGKDRSHECKNSTENLEKELSQKTSTLTKVKRTYL